MNHRRNSHCAFCGNRFPEPVVRYAKCAACGNETWISPFPVSVLILPVESADGALGVLLVRRGIEPCRGQWCLPGGYLQQDESLETGAFRENQEESTVKLPPDWPIRLTHSRPVAADTKQIIVFCEAQPIAETLLPDPFKPSDEETEAIMVTRQPIKLCFGTHTEALRMYFDRPEAAKPR